MIKLSFKAVTVYPDVRFLGIFAMVLVLPPNRACGFLGSTFGWSLSIAPPAVSRLVTGMYLGEHFSEFLFGELGWEL